MMGTYVSAPKAGMESIVILTRISAPIMKTTVCMVIALTELVLITTAIAAKHILEKDVINCSVQKITAATTEIVFYMKITFRATVT